MDEDGRRLPLIKVVGPCAAGKTTLTNRLRALGYNARQIAQEHSEVPDMWRRIHPPDVLIYLDARDETLLRRRPKATLPALLPRQRRRLAHARAHADLVVETDDLTPEEVLARVVAFLEQHGIPRGAPLPPQRAGHLRTSGEDISTSAS